MENLPESTSGKDGSPPKGVPPPGWMRHVLIVATAFVFHGIWSMTNSDYTSVQIDAALAVGIVVFCFIVRRNQVQNTRNN